MRTHSLLEEAIPLDQPAEIYKQAQQIFQQGERKIREAEALLLTIALIFGELKQPLTVVLGLSNLLLTNADQDDPLAADLITIGAQINRMNEIVKGIDQLSHYKVTS